MEKNAIFPKLVERLSRMEVSDISYEDLRYADTIHNNSKNQPSFRLYASLAKGKGGGRKAPQKVPSHANSPSRRSKLAHSKSTTKKINVELAGPVDNNKKKHVRGGRVRKGRSETHFDSNSRMLDEDEKSITRKSFLDQPGVITQMINEATEITTKNVNCTRRGTTTTANTNPNSFIKEVPASSPPSSVDSHDNGDVSYNGVVDRTNRQEEEQLPLPIPQPVKMELPLLRGESI